MTCDLKDFFLATPMLKPEYMKIHYKYIPHDIRDHYNLDAKLAKMVTFTARLKKGYMD